MGRQHRPGGSILTICGEPRPRPAMHDKFRGTGMVAGGNAQAEQGAATGGDVADGRADDAGGVELAHCAVGIVAAGEAGDLHHHRAHYLLRQAGGGRCGRRRTRRRRRLRGAALATATGATGALRAGGALGGRLLTATSGTALATPWVVAGWPRAGMASYRQALDQAINVAVGGGTRSRYRRVLAAATAVSAARRSRRDGFWASRLLSPGCSARTSTLPVPRW